MKRILILVPIFLFVNLAVLSISSSPASAHGVGGIEPTNSKAVITSIVPESSSFKAESIENGERFRVTRTSNKNVIVLGVDGEPYILIDSRGSFINSKSATHLINKSSSSDYDGKVSKEDFSKTSSDPNQIPDWQKFSNSQSHSWHDHRAHYMGTVPSNVKDLGSSTLELKIDDKLYVVNISFVASPNGSGFLALYTLLGLLLLLLIFTILKPEIFKRIMSKPAVIILLLLIFVFESLHVWGYIFFSQRSLTDELASTMYSVGLIVLSRLAAFRVSKNSASYPKWEDELNKQAPLISLTAFVGLFVGVIFEYKTFTYDYLPTIYTNLFSQILITSIAFFSSCLLILGLRNMNATKNNEELLPIAKD